MSVRRFKMTVKERHNYNKKSSKITRYALAVGTLLFVFSLIYYIIDLFTENTYEFVYEAGPESENVKSPSLFQLPSDIRKLKQTELKQDKATKKFQLVLEDCRIPNVPLYSEEYNNTKRDWDFVTCPRSGDKQPISSLDKDGNVILKSENCCYQSINRPVGLIHDRYRISDECIPIKEDNNEIKEEFFQIKCNKEDNEPSKTEFHATIQLTPKIQKKLQFWETKVPNENERPPSVLMLAIDSTSRTSLHRNLPKTRNILKQMNFMDFTGHHALGEPTLPNEIPLLFGTSAEDFWKEKTEWKSRWDKYPFIWKEFDKLNYLTFFMEDEQQYGTFVYGQQTGFRYQPTDIYPRPLLFAREEYIKQQNTKGGKQCFGDEIMPEYLLKYQKTFLEKTRGFPSFSLSWFTWPQHDFMEMLPHLDDPLTNFLSALSNDEEILENTVIILFSDHSSWSAPYSQTKNGLLERRLPFLYIRYPQKLQRYHNGPQQFANLKNNQNRITSHYDTHQTLLHLAKMAAIQTNQNQTLKNKEKPGYSLIEEIPQGRTCSDAKIPTFMCTCDLNLNDAAALKLSPPIHNAFPLNQ